MGIFQSYSPNNFQIHNIVLTIVAILYISMTNLFYNWKLIAIDTFTHFRPLPPFASGKH